MYPSGKPKWILDIIRPLNQHFNPIPTGQGRNQPLYERHVTKSGRNRVKLKIQKNRLKQVWMFKLWNVINCVFVNWTKLTLGGWIFQLILKYQTKENRIFILQKRIFSMLKINKLIFTKKNRNCRFRIGCWHLMNEIIQKLMELYFPQCYTQDHW